MSKTEYFIRVNGRYYKLLMGLEYDYGNRCDKCHLKKGCKSNRLSSKIFQMCDMLDGCGFRAAEKAREEGKR